MKELSGRVDEITKMVRKNFDDQVEFLKLLVREPSINNSKEKNEGGEEGVAQLIKRKLNELGLNASYLRFKKHRPNVISSWGEQRGRRSLALIGHMDTAEPIAGSRSRWFSGEIQDDRLYGVGALDMKATLTAYIFAVKALRDLKIDPVGRLKLAFTADGKSEAVSEAGLKFLLKKGFSAKAAILGKQGLGKIATGHRGGYRFKITTYGQTVDTGRRAWERGLRGKNAIYDMGRIMRLLSNFDLPYKPAKAFPGRLPVFTFPTKITGGKSISMVPDKCEAWGDVRLLPGNTDIQVRMWIEEKLAQVTDIKWEISDILYVPSMEVEKAERLVRILYDSACQVLEKKPKVEGCGPWNESWMLTCHGMPCIAGFGPEGMNNGEGETGDEWVSLLSVRQVTEIYALVIARYLGSPTS
ncbi:M20 family metallopeptidase [Candidatus Collierbacteria bacterium]|nr:M20 family metallopeptidase [Candidatus Collierbacteria bacterium]